MGIICLVSLVTLHVVSWLAIQMVWYSFNRISGRSVFFWRIFGRISRLVSTHLHVERYLAVQISQIIMNIAVLPHLKIIFKI